MKNWLERTPRTMGDWLALAAGTALLLAAAGQLPGLLRAAAGLLALLAPFGWGLVLAYVLDIPTRFFAAKLFGGRRGAGGQLCAAVWGAGPAGGAGRAPAGAEPDRLCRAAGRV